MAKREIYECDVCNKDIPVTPRVIPTMIWVTTGTETNGGYGLEVWQEAINYQREYEHQIACSTVCALELVRKFLLQEK